MSTRCARARALARGACLARRERAPDSPSPFPSRSPPPCPSTAQGDEAVFAFSYPYSYQELQTTLEVLDARHGEPAAAMARCGAGGAATAAPTCTDDEIFYHRELLTYSLDGRRLDLVTISDCSGIADPSVKEDWIDDDGAGGDDDELGGGGGYESEEGDDNQRGERPSGALPPAARAASAASGGGSKGAAGGGSPWIFPERRGSTVAPSLVAEAAESPDRGMKERARAVAEATRGVRPPRFEGKEEIMLSARVHPGETPAAFTMDGALHFLLKRDDPRAIALRRKYVIRLIPMLNPDGVARGHYRHDTRGVNLNRVYMNPSAKVHPTVRAAHAVALSAASEGRMALYVDMHAHATKRGCFFYGNALDSGEQQVENQLMALLLSVNSRHFDYSGCNFSPEHMHRVDKGEHGGMSAEVRARAPRTPRARAATTTHPRSRARAARRVRAASRSISRRASCARTRSSATTTRAAS